MIDVSLVWAGLYKRKPRIPFEVKHAFRPEPAKLIFCNPPEHAKIMNVLQPELSPTYFIPHPTRTRIEAKINLVLMQLWKVFYCYVANTNFMFNIGKWTNIYLSFKKLWIDDTKGSLIGVLLCSFNTFVTKCEITQPNKVNHKQYIFYHKIYSNAILNKRCICL